MVQIEEEFLTPKMVFSRKSFFWRTDDGGWRGGEANIEDDKGILHEWQSRDIAQSIIFSGQDH